jgi:hypothetical protein
MAKPNPTTISRPAETEADVDVIPQELLGDFTEKENLSFPPYWKSAVGRRFLATVVALDDSDPAFERWVFQAKHAMTCFTGPKDDAKPTKIQAGDYFTTSAYAQFGNAKVGLSPNRGLMQYVGEDVLIACTGTQDTGQPTPMFVHEVHVSKETKARLLAKRQDRQTVAFAQRGVGAAGATITKPATAS